MNDMKLIEAVRAYKELYDCSLPQYTDTIFKEQIWNDIGLELNQPGHVCKARWNNIRDNYRKSLKKRLSAGGLSRQKMKRYKYEAVLSFLDSYFHKRESKLSIIGTDDNDIDYEENESYEISKHIEDKVHTKEEENILPDDNFNEYRRSTRVRRKRPVPSMNETNKRKLRKPTTSTFTRYFIDRPKLDADPVDTFLTSISTTLKAFTPYYLNIAKSKIFSIVQEMELAMILEEKNSASANNTMTGSPETVINQYDY